MVLPFLCGAGEFMSVFAIKPWTNEKAVYYNGAEWGNFPYVHEK